MKNELIGINFLELFKDKEHIAQAIYDENEEIMASGIPKFSQTIMLWEAGI